MDKPVSIYKMVGSGAVAAADIAVTLTAGSADVDVSSATVPRNYKGHLLKIYDSSNRCIQGFVYTNGAGTVQNVVSAKGGTTRNWAAQAAGFDDTTNCRYELWQVNNAVEVASGSIAVNQMLADTTATNAFVAPVGVDLSAYQTGKYIFAAYNTVGGYAAFGYIKGTAPGGEALGSQLAPVSCCTDPLDNQDVTTGWSLSGVGTLSSEGAGPYYLKVLAGADNAYAYKSLVLAVGGLYKLDLKTAADNGVNAQYMLTGCIGPFSVAGTGEGNWTTISNKYGTITVANPDIRLLTRFNTYSSFYSEVVLKQVTDCAATGALIVSAKDGATRSWSYKNALFNPNIASTFKIFYTGD